MHIAQADSCFARLCALQTILSLVELKPALIRGNASEVMAVAGAVGSVRGVDSTASAAEALELGQALSRRVGCVVAISGATDLVRVPQLYLCSVARISTWPAVQDCAVGVSSGISPFALALVSLSTVAQQ